MVQLRSSLKVADNSGGREMVVIHVYGSSSKKKARLGDVVQCVIRACDPHGIVKDDELVPVVLVRTKKEYRRADGSYIRFDDNAGVVLTSRTDFTPRGTRVFGPIARELKEKGFDKIISMAEEVL